MDPAWQEPAAEHWTCSYVKFMSIACVVFMSPAGIDRFMIILCFFYVSYAIHMSSAVTDS